MNPSLKTVHLIFIIKQFFGTKINPSFQRNYRFRLTSSGVLRAKNLSAPTRKCRLWRRQFFYLKWCCFKSLTFVSCHPPTQPNQALHSHTSPSYLSKACHTSSSRLQICHSCYLTTALNGGLNSVQCSSHYYLFHFVTFCLPTKWFCFVYHMHQEICALLGVSFYE